MKLLQLAFMLCMIAAGSSSAAVINLNTGGAGVAWQVTQTSGTDNGLGIGVTGSAPVLTGTLPFAANLPGFEAFAWANPFGGAVWVGQLPTDGQFTNGSTITCGSPCGATAGTYSYSLSFDGSPGGSMVLSGFTADNRVMSLNVVQANNGTLYSCTSSGPGTLCAGSQAAVTASTGTLNLAAVAGGAVTITALVLNLDGPGRNPSGFILAGSANINDTLEVPEPSSLAMMAIGAVAVLSRARRRSTSR